VIAPCAIAVSQNVATHIRLEQSIAASRALIWQACASVEGISRWQADQTEGELRAGGRVTLHWAAFGTSVELDVVELVTLERLVFTPGSSRVELEIGERNLTLSHSGLELEDDVEGLASSWRLALAQLAHSVERHPGEPRKVEWLLRRARTSPESAYFFFTDPHCLSLWLTTAGGIGEPGSDYDLRVRGGFELRGSVLQNVSGRDVAITCRNHGDAVLVLRTLPSPLSKQERVVALMWSEWGDNGSGNSGLLGQIERSLDPLVRLLDSGGKG
jgi:uncharacterized protein YndB with AHSA1/START domain